MWGEVEPTPEIVARQVSYQPLKEVQKGESMEEGFKACPYCAEPIREAAIVCRFCNRQLAVDQLNLDRPWAPATPAEHPVSKSSDSMVVIVSGAIFSAIIIAILVAHSSHGGKQTGDTDRDAAAALSPSLLGQQIAAPPTPRPVLVKVLDGNLEIGAGQIMFYTVTVPDDAYQGKGYIHGDFHAFGGQGNDIWVTLSTPSDFENWKNGHEALLLYNSGKTTNGELDVQGLPVGSYILAFDNRFSAFSRKEVTGTIQLGYFH